MDAGIRDASDGAATTDDGGTAEDDGGAFNAEVGPDTALVFGPEVGPDAPVDSPVDAWVGEVGDALSTDGDFENCYLAIKNNNYAAQGADPCSSCKENEYSRETECKAKLDCLAAAGAECVSGSNCYTDCMNAGGGGTPAATCAANLVTAACL